MIESYLKNKTKFKKIFSKTSMLYSLTSVLSKKLIASSTASKAEIETCNKILKLEYETKIKFDASLILHMNESETIIDYYKAFHDVVKIDLPKDHYDMIKNVAAVRLKS